MIKQFLIIILLVGSIQFLAAEDNFSERKITFYAGMNPLALISFLPNGMGTSGTLWGTASGQEFGISLYGGMCFAKAHSVEMRFSTGPADAVMWDTQVQLGYIWYPFEQFLNRKGGLNTGLMLRQFFWNNGITGYVIFNFTPELLLGWRFKLKSLAFDLRAGWNIASVTWSTMPYTKAGAKWLQLPYNLALTTGVAWTFN